MNGELSDLLKKVSFIQHSLNSTLDLAIRAGHDTHRLERIISLIEQDLRAMRYELRQPAKPEAAATATEPCPERWADN